jgi:hypothetical protein
MLDAFSSDSIPARLVSREALEIYLGSRNRTGVLFHVSTGTYGLGSCQVGV